jgi:tetratricopeptide (TPR) repeat protein
MCSGFKSHPDTRVLNLGYSDYGYGSVIPTRTWIFEDIMQSAEDALKKGQYNKALQEFDKLICMRPENASCRIRRADTLVQLGRLTEALTDYDEVYQLYPADGELQQKLSLFHLR